MTLGVWAAFALTELTLSLLPGPAVLLICAQAFRSGRRASARGALGIVTGNAVYFGLSALGLGALLLASAGLFQAVRIAGAAYLVYLGVRMLPRADAHTSASSPSAPTADGWRCFLQALLTQLLNPKALLFFTALLPQFISPTHGDLPLQFVLLGVTSIAIELPALLLYGWLAARGRHHLPVYLALFGQRTGGVLLVGAGLSLALRQDG